MNSVLFVGLAEFAKPRVQQKIKTNICSGGFEPLACRLTAQRDITTTRIKAKNNYSA